MPKRILVVDDDECVRFVFRRALMSLGGDFDVTTAGGGREALDQVGEGMFDLVITDLRMPGIDGIRLTEAIRVLDPRAVVIWMTAYGCNDTESAAVRLGVDTWLQKPLEVGEIRASVLAALDRAHAGATESHTDGEGGHHPVTQAGGSIVG